MAHVYVGRGLDRGVEEIVALKVIRGEYENDARFLRMFSDEAKILAQLSHPNVIRTIEYGITREHRFIVMELLAGRTLAEVWDLLAARGEALSLPLGAWICARVASGLHAAHELRDSTGVPLSVVHRDVNPSNIFLTHTGEVKLIDFGLAKARVRRDRTAGGIVKGKIPYLAPEQLELIPIDRRVDIYALGTTLWELGSMRRLFKRATDFDTLAAIREANVPDLREIVARFPKALYAVVDRALQRDREERYPTADGMATDLDVVAAASLLDMPGELTRLLSRLFPGERSKYSTWHDEAIAVRAMATVAPPPMPVPLPSSNLCDEYESVDIELDEEIEE